MKLRAIFRLELGYQLQRVSTWFYFVVLLLITLQIASEVGTDYARTSGTFANDPYFIAMMTLLGSLMGLLVAAAVAGDAATRDVQARMDPLVYTTAIAKSVYLASRYLAAVALQLICLSAVPMALLAVWLLAGADVIGPLRPAAYLSAYLFLLAPNALIATAMLFALAVLSRRSIAAYIGALLLFGLTLVGYLVVALTLQNWELAKLLDPSGGVVVAELGRLWTPAEKGTRLIALEGSLLWNRVLWIGIAGGCLALTSLRFLLAHHAGRSWIRASRRHIEEPPIGSVPMRVPRLSERTFGAQTWLRQALALARESFVAIVTGWGGAIVAGVTALVVVNGMQLTHMGVPLMATTERMTALRAYSVTVWLLIAFCAGELVWREREGRVDEIASAVPVHDWVALLGRFMGLSLVLFLQLALVAAAQVFDQAFLGYYDFDFAVYAQIFGLDAFDYLLVVVLAVVVQVLVNHKYVAHVLVAMAVMIVPARRALGLEHTMLVYGADTNWTYSDMRGFAPFIGPWFWFNLYWAAWGLLLAVIATVVRVRGTETSWRARLAQARRRCTPPLVVSAAIVAAVTVTLGAFVFYNTNVLNAYQRRSDVTARHAEYERRYSRFKSVPQPRITRVSVNVDIFPANRAADVRGTFDLVNGSSGPIETVHVAMPFGVNVREIAFDRATRPVLADDEHGHRTYRLEQPLQPGTSLQLRFVVRHKPLGFTNDGIDASVVSNGTFFQLERWLPSIGYQPERELRSAGERSVYGLTARAALDALHESAARDDSAQAARVAFEAVVGTDAGQTAVAPGSLRRTWTKGGRRYFHYVADAPIRDDYAVFSAGYRVHETTWNGVAVQVVHHPGHAPNVARMAGSVQASLEHYTRWFGRPYPHRVIRLVEHPGDAMVLHASPVNVSYEEPFALLNPAADPRSVDLSFAVVAHEVAHQWWGGMVTPARVEGGALLTESLAWYSALALVEETLGRDHVRRLLGMMRDAYLSPAERGNVPLLRADDWFLAYRKGPFAMWALRQYVGAGRIDAVLQRIVNRYGSGEPPLPTSLDLYRELQAVTPGPLQYLLADLFETNTYWELETQRASATQMPAGQWQVTLDVVARKVIVDEAGVETDVPMDDLIEAGVFTGTDEPQFVQMQRIRTGRQRITLTVPIRPVRAAIDPRHLLIDLDGPNNAQDVR
jgi:ABC-2 type transport system permease protein